jgi:glycosyltransferase involved in cell wall biosynthesis
MRIAQIAPPWLPISTIGYGGVENVVAVLTDGLAERGHDVTLFASGGSSTKARLRSYYEEPLGTTCQVTSPLLGLPHVLAAYRSISEFDVVHDHMFPFGPALGVLFDHPPVVHTVHTSPASPHAAPIYELVSDRLPLVAVSVAQARANPNLRFTATIHNGIPMRAFEFRSLKDDYMLFVGQMSPRKGVHLAVAAARVLDRPLLIAAKMRNPEEISYFESQVKPLLTPAVVYLGEVAGRDKAELFAGAACTLAPIQWQEPFGLVMIESLASGTPVVAFHSGSAAEIIEHGVTGFLARDFEEFVRFADRVGEIDPAACRRAAEDRFGAERMIGAYERLYASLCR